MLLLTDFQKSVCTRAAFQSAFILLCDREEQEGGAGLDLHAHYFAETDINSSGFILCSVLQVLAELLLFYGMHSFNSQPVFSVTKISR